MKYEIDRHRNNLVNRKKSLERDKENFDRAEARYLKRKSEVGFYEAQIDLAEKEGKDGFDEDKYAIKRLCY